jgi:hypothetical protein
MKVWQRVFIHHASTLLKLDKKIDRLSFLMIRYSLI